jgi:hypothetical protein
MLTWHQLLVWGVLASGVHPDCRAPMKPPADPPPAAQVIPNPLQADPVIPIPTGRAAQAGYSVRIERSQFGSIIYCGRRDESGVRAECSISRVGGTRINIPLFETDYSQTSAVFRRHSFGARSEVHIANSLDALFELETTLTGPLVGVRFMYWLCEGISCGVGLDSSLGVVLHLELNF